SAVGDRLARPGRGDPARLRSRLRSERMGAGGTRADAPAAPERAVAARARDQSGTGPRLATRRRAARCEWVGSAAPAGCRGIAPGGSDRLLARIAAGAARRAGRIDPI